MWQQQQQSCAGACSDSAAEHTSIAANARTRVIEEEEFDGPTVMGGMGAARQRSQIAPRSRQTESTRTPSLSQACADARSGTKTGAQAGT